MIEYFSIGILLVISLLGFLGLYWLIDYTKKYLTSLNYQLQGKLNNTKGNLAELITYLKLGGAYDRVFSVSGLVDFIGVIFPTDKDPGKVSFIEVKSGQARLSKDQAMLKDIIEKGKVEFIKVKVDIDV